MLKIELKNKSDENIVVLNPLSVVLNSDLDVPADDIIVTLPYQKGLCGNADYIFAYSGNSLVFKGQIDAITNIKNGSCAITKITARGLAALLLDNEAEPLTYINPAADFIFNRHLKQFGISEFIADKLPFYGQLKISKGMTHWQVFYNFCKNRFGKTPRITGDGQAVADCYDSKNTVVFCDSGNGVHYYSINQSQNRYRLISDVRIMTDEKSGYNSTVYNSNPECAAVKRTRFVNAAADTGTIETADKIIRQSNRQSFVVTLNCAECLTDVIGRKAVICDSVFGTFENMIITSLCYSLGTDGEKTTVTLRKVW